MQQDLIQVTNLEQKNYNFNIQNINNINFL